MRNTPKDSPEVLVGNSDKTDTPQPSVARIIAETAAAEEGIAKPLKLSSTNDPTDRPIFGEVTEEATS